MTQRWKGFGLTPALRKGGAAGIKNNKTTGGRSSGS